MADYQITIRFSTDRALTEDEQELILSACEVQVDEPADLAGDSMDVDVRIVESDLIPGNNPIPTV
jgi:hypothetical protein